MGNLYICDNCGYEDIFESDVPVMDCTFCKDGVLVKQVVKE